MVSRINRPPPLKAKSRVGGINSKTNYVQDEKAFHVSDLPVDKRRNKVQVKIDSRPNILGNSKEDWNQSVQTGAPPCLRNSCQNAKHDPFVWKYNYRAEQLPKTQGRFVPKSTKLQFNEKCLLKSREKPHQDRSKLIRKRTEEMPVHSKLENKEKWNSSITVLTREKAERDERDFKASVENSKAKNAALLNYQNPTQRAAENMRKLRKEKMEGKKKSKNTPLNLRSVNNEEDEELKKYPFKFVSTNHKSRKYKEYYNDGKWEYSNIEGCYVWSCSMNTNQDFKGSCYKVRNPDAWNFASP